MTLQRTSSLYERGIADFVEFMKIPYYLSVLSRKQNFDPTTLIEIAVYIYTRFQKGFPEKDI